MYIAFYNNGLHLQHVFEKFQGFLTFFIHVIYNSYFIDANGNPVTQSVVGVTDASGNPVTGNIDVK